MEISRVTVVFCTFFFVAASSSARASGVFATGTFPVTYFDFKIVTSLFTIFLVFTDTDGTVGGRGGGGVFSLKSPAKPILLFPRPCCKSAARRVAARPLIVVGPSRAPTGRLGRPLGPGAKLTSDSHRFFAALDMPTAILY